jgi:hypothetical protein
MAEYAVFRVASASVVVVRLRVDPAADPAAMVSVSMALAVSGVAKESVTTKVKDLLDAAAGVPEMVPPVDRLNPAGKVLPAPRAQV